MARKTGKNQTKLFVLESKVLLHDPTFLLRFHVHYIYFDM